MLTLKQLINRYLYMITLVLILFSLMVISIIQIKLTQDHTYKEALLTLSQIEQIMIENQQELEIIEDEYRQTCLLNAKIISRLIETTPEMLYNIEELRTVAFYLEIDEIHIFDKTGRIFTGTHPEYYNYSFDSGEQMAFFKPLLTDKSLELVQDMTPNTADNKLMQYSALWCNNGEYIIQIGMEPVNVKKSTLKNELSYIFSLFRVNPNVFYYAINADTGKIIGASQLETVNLDCSEIGFSLNDIKNSDKGIHVNINGKDCFCIFHKVDSTYIGYATTLQYMYYEIPTVICTLFLCLIIVSVILVKAFNEYMKNHIVDKIHKINTQLADITNGNLQQNVDVRNIFELSELSTHINNMVKNLLSSNAKLTYIFSKANFYVGTYEYSNTAQYVRFSEYIPKLFSLDEEEIKVLSANPDDFRNFVAKTQEHIVPNTQNIYEIKDKYIRIDEFLENDYTLGVAIDVTNEIENRKKFEYEIQIDSLTGLYNRKGFEAELSKLFSAPEDLGYYAMIKIMANGLVKINDSYGHEAGNLYLQKLATLLKDFGIKNSLASRQYGGEFILFLYGYNSEQELSKAINLLTYIQKHTIAHLNDNIDVSLDFSFDYYIFHDSEYTDYQLLLKDTTDKK